MTTQEENTTETEIRNRLDRLVDRARDDMEYIITNMNLSRSNRVFLQYADARVKMLETDIEHIRDAIHELEELRG